MSYVALSDEALNSLARHARACGLRGDLTAARDAGAMERELRRRLTEPLTKFESTAFAPLGLSDEFHLPMPHRPARPEPSLGELLRNLRQLLDMDIAYVAHFEAGQRVISALDLESREVELEVGDTIEEEQTYCWRVAQGALEPAIPDAQLHPAVRDLPITSQLKIRSYLAVPVILSNGALYGTVCCISHTPRTAFGSRDYDALQSVAALVGKNIERYIREGGLLESGFRD